VLQPSPVPRFNRTPGSIASPPAMAGPLSDPALESWGIQAERIAELRASGALL
jgi:alpha-methylacyl-CoA racemase